MRVTFVLPAFSRGPVGGFKVIYEYANRLAERGFTVQVVHPKTVEPRSGGVLRRLNARLWPLRMRLRHGPWRRKPLLRWFPLRPDVRMVLVPDLRERFIPDADAIVATAWQTAEMVRHLGSAKGKKLYHVTEYEWWMTESAEVRARMAETHRAGFTMIAISPSVEEMLRTNGARDWTYIPVGLDLASYGIDAPIETRPSNIVGFPVRPETFKGAADAFEAVRLLRARSGGAAIRFTAFGRKGAPGLPDGVEFLEFPSDADLRRFYNSLAVFVFPSHYEGWGLPGTEALACGAALVTADCVGMRDYARDGETALVVPRGRPDLLAQAVERLVSDDALRHRLARDGHRHVQQYTWTRAVDGLERLLRSV